MTATQVVWVEGTDANPRPAGGADRRRPTLLPEMLWDDAPSCSQRHPPRRGCRAAAGSAPAQIDELDVGSPFDYEANALLYCATHLPDPRHPSYVEALTDELGDLIEAAGGRTLALFTSFRVLDEARRRPPAAGSTCRSSPSATCPRLGCSSSSPPTSDLPLRHHGLLAGRRRAGCHAEPRDHRSHPVPSARRAAAAGPARASRRGSAFGLIDLPRAATLLAQGAGRLIRTSDRSRRRGRPRPAARQGRLPMGDGAGAAADAPHQGSRRGPPRARGDPGPAVGIRVRRVDLPP